MFYQNVDVEQERYVHNIKLVVFLATVYQHKHGHTIIHDTAWGGYLSGHMPRVLSK